MSEQPPAVSNADPAVVESIRARRKLASSIIGLWVVMGAYVMFFGFPEEHAPMLGKIYIGILLVSMGPILWKWRCPRCSKYLGGAYTAKFCPGCGVKFTLD